MQKTFQLSRATENFSKHAHAHHRSMNDSSCEHHTTSFPPFKTYSNNTPRNAHFHRQLTKCQIHANSAASKLPLFYMCYLKLPVSVILTYVSDKSYFYSILHNKKVIFRKAHGLVIAELTIFYHKCFSTLYATRQVWLFS